MENSATGQLVAKYGYLAVLIGTMLEGETIVLVAGFFAHQGYLTVPFIIVAAVIGSAISDQGLFFLARLRGVKILRRFPRALAKVQGLADKACRRPAMLTSFALLFRFFYGVRNVAPIFLGLSTLPTLRFVILNGIGAVVWATTFSCGGYFFAKALHSVMGTLARYEIALAAILVAGGIGFNFWQRYKKANALPLAVHPESESIACPPLRGEEACESEQNSPGRR